MRRTKILVITDHIDQRAKEWYNVIRDEMENGMKKKVKLEGNRVHTPYAIMDCVLQRPIYTGGYSYILPDTINSEDVLDIAVGRNSSNRNGDGSEKSE